MSGAHEIIVNGRRVKYWVWHPDRPSTIIILHGFRGSHKGLMRVAEQLTDYHVIIPDLPGYGESEPLDMPHDFPHYADWLINFAAAINLTTYTLAGHSYGASLALVAASRGLAGLQRLILIEPVINAQTWTSRLGEWFYRTATHLPPRPRQWWVINPVFNRITTELLTTLRDREAKQHLVHEEMQNLHYAIAHVEIESFLGFYQADFPTAAAAISVPTLIIAGARDQMIPLPTMRRLQTSIANSSIQVIPGAGHFAPMEAPVKIATIVNGWLSAR